VNRRDLFRCISFAAAMRLRAQVSASSQIDDLVAADRILAAHEIFDAYGHVSVRSEKNPQRYFMSRSLAPDLVTADDILEYDLDSNVVGASGAALFLERFIHGEVYKARPDVKAVVHCHTPSLIPFGATDVPLRPMFGLAGFIAEGVPVFEIRKTAGMTDLLIRDAARGRALARVQAQAMALSKNVTYLTAEEGKISVADDYRRAWELWRRQVIGK
jgi:ribulose-5-phosphate 4-epimerase/fuculose-1-phosphate aldolase